MKESHNYPKSKILFWKFYLSIALLLFCFFPKPLKADQNNTAFIVAGGNLAAPFYTLTFESNGSAVDFDSYPLRKGNTYIFKGGNISESHPFNIGSSYNVSSSHATGGPLNQNSGANGQSITVSIPNDFQGTLAYFCTVHASMNRSFTILEPNPVDQNGTNFLPVYDLNSTHLFQLTGSESVPEGNYSIVDINGTLTAIPMNNANGQWQENPGGVPYPLVQNFSSMQQVDAYLQLQNLYPVNEPQGFPVFDLNATQVTNLTNGAANQAGHYAVVDVNQSFVDLEPVQQDGNGSWIVTPADDYVNLVPSHFSDFNVTKAWFDANASAPVAFLSFDNNHSQPNDHNQSNPGSGPNDHNGSTHIAVFDLNSTHLFQLTGSESVPEGNYSIVDINGTLTAIPMNNTNGQWQENPGGVPYPLVQNFSSMQQVDAYLQSQNLHPVNEPQGFPVFDLNATQVTNLTNGAANQAGHYAVVDVNESFVDLEPVQQDGNGSWIVTPADDYVNLVPSHFSDFNVTKAWFDANASAPVAFLSFDNNHSQPNDHNQSNPGSGGDHNDTEGMPIFALSITQAEILADGIAPAGNYAFEIFLDQGGVEIRQLIGVTEVAGIWERSINQNGQQVIYPISSAHFPTTEAIDTYIDEQGLVPTGFVFEDTAPGTDPNELTYSGTDGTGVGNNDKRQHLFDALYAKHIKDNPDPNALENFLPTWLGEEEKTYYRQFSESLNLEPKEKREELIIDFVYNMIDENNNFFAFQDLREEISFSIDFNGTVDFSTGRPEDRMVDAIYSISSPHEVEKIKITFRHPNHKSFRDIDIEINSKTANGIKNFEYSPWFEHNSTTGNLEIVPSNINIVVNSPDRGTVTLAYYSDTDNQFTKLTGVLEDQWPAVKFKNLVDDRQKPELLNMEVIDGVYDYDAPSDGLDIKIHAKDHGGSGIRSILTYFTKEGNDGEPSIHESMYVSFVSSHDIISRRVHDYNGRISPRLLENRWEEPGTWTLSKLSIEDRTRHQIDYNESELIEILGELPTIVIKGSKNEKDTPNLDSMPPKIVKAEVELKEAKLFLQVDERDEIEEVEIELFQDIFGNRWHMFHAGDEDITISPAEEGKWLVELDLSDLLEEFPRDAFTSAFAVNSLLVRDSNGQAEAFNVNDQQSLQNLIFDQSYAGEIDDKHPTLLAVIPSNSVASESTNLSLVFHAPIDIAEGHIGLSNNSHTANLDIHFDLSEGENVVNAWREDNLLVVEVKNLDPHFATDFAPQEPEDKYFYLNNYHLEGIHGEHFENYRDPYAGSESESEVPLLFSKPILQIEEPWGGDHEEEEDYNNIFNVLATDTSIDFGGENGVYPANGGPLRITLAGFSGIDYSKRVQIELSSMDGKENVSIEADYQTEEATAPEEHPDIDESLERFRDHYNLSGHAAVTKDGKLVIEANRASLSGRYYISEIRFDHGYHKTYDSHNNPTNAHNSIYLIQGFGHFMIEPLPEEDAEEIPVIEKIELSPNFIDIDSEESSEFSVTVLGKDITEVAAIFAQSFSPWHNYLDVQMDLNNATPVGEAKVFSTVLQPSVPGIYHLVAISLTNSKGDKISLYDDDLETPMEESPLDEDFPFDIPSLVAKGAFPSVVQMERPQNKESADELVKKFYASETPPATKGDYEGPIDLDEFHDEEPQTLPPLLKTNSKVNLSEDVATLTAVLLSDGNNSDLELGFQVSDSIFFDDAEEILVNEKLKEESLFAVSLDLTTITARRIYFRAFARNQHFESFGSKKRFRLPEIQKEEDFSLFPDATILEDGWKENWLGVFHEYSNGWMYHLDLGWCFASPDNRGNVWLWINDHGWVWTNGSTWPHLYRNQTSSWLYLLIRQSGPAVFFDQMHGSFMHLNK